MRRCFVVALGLLPICCGASGAGFSLSLTANEPAGVARKAEPVSGGIPLPPKMFKKGQPFALFDGGTAIPVQVSPLVVDNDGWLRWMLVDTQVDLKAGEAKTLTLKASKGRATLMRPLKVTTTDDGVVVNTQRITFTVSNTKPFGLFTTAVVNGQRALASGDVMHVLSLARPVVTGGEVSYVDGFDGKRYVAGKPSSIDIEYAGPMRTTVAVKGRFVGDDKNRLQYIARITAWAGKSVVHVKYSISNSNPDHYCYRTLQDSSIKLNLAGPVKGAMLGASKPIAAGADAALEQHLRVRGAGNGKALDGGKIVWASKGAKNVAEGWIAAKTGKGSVYACDLYFTDDPARRLAVKDGALVLTGVMERERAKKDARGREPGKPYNDTKRVLYDCSHLSSQYLIDFAAPADAVELSRIRTAARERTWLMAPPEWYLHGDHFGFGKFGTQKDEMKCYDTWGWTYDPKRAPKTPRARYGRYFAGIDSHYEPEEDVVSHLVIMYLRTGSRAYFNAARTWANYWTDLYAWRTDGWRWKDGGVWWDNGPKGNRPQRAKDPVTGLRERISSGRARPPMTKDMVRDQYFVSDSKCCYCHNWAAGLFEWFLLTGDRDTLEAAVDRVEQDYDRNARAQGFIPGKANYFRRGFTRSAYGAHVARMLLPQDEWLRKVSDYFFEAYRQRPTPEPRGFVNSGRRPRDLRLRLPRNAKPEDRAAAEKKLIEKFALRYTGQQGLDEMKRLGIVYDFQKGVLRDPKTGREWSFLADAHTWMFPPLSRAMELYYRLTGNEDAMDWTIAFGQASDRLLSQEHTWLTYGRLLVDFPVRGVAKDYASWTKTDKYGQGIKGSGFLARFQPDVCARAYSLTGEPLLKRKAYDWWLGGSHRHFGSTAMKPLDRVAWWVNYVGDHDGQVDFVLRNFYIHAHPRKDAAPPTPIKDLKVTVNGKAATVTFTAPADQGGGKVTRYQLKCSDKPIVSYQQFLDIYNRFEDDKYTNWWMAANLAGEPTPKAPGAKERFVISGLPANARYFALRSFDDSSNRSAISNVRLGVGP